MAEKLHSEKLLSILSNLASNWIMRYDYRVSIGAYPFVIALVISLVIAVLSVSMQTCKVVKANAVDALKHE